MFGHLDQSDEVLQFGQPRERGDEGERRRGGLGAATGDGSSQQQGGEQGEGRSPGVHGDWSGVRLAAGSAMTR